MSIFRDTFEKNIQASLKERQTAMTRRSTTDIQWMNARNTWIKMQSSVNVGGSATLASQYVLFGGTLTPSTSNALGKFKSGIGNTGMEAYSNKSISGKDFGLGYRPMPGITGIEVKSKSAYGSLREAVVSFQCWDIADLENLELLYMRPGYTVQVDWGWTPYLIPGGKYEPSPAYGNNLITQAQTTRTAITNYIYDKSISTYGNYDGLFGYVKNYQWSLRADGGYDCQTTIISTGEIVESLKVNYVRPDLKDYKVYDSTSKGDGFLNNDFKPQGDTPSTDYAPHYEKNTLCGMWFEIYKKIIDPAVTDIDSSNPKSALYNLPNAPEHFYINPSKLNPTPLIFEVPGDDSIFDGKNNVFISLEAAIRFINKYIIPVGSNNEPLAEVSVYSNEYSGNKTKEYLTCLAHPLQVSVDPSICLIKSPLWIESTGSVITAVAANPAVASQAAIGDSIYNDIVTAHTSLIQNNTLLESAWAKVTTPEMYEYLNQKFQSGGTLDYPNGCEGYFRDQWESSWRVLANAQPDLWAMSRVMDGLTKGPNKITGLTLKYSVSFWINATTIDSYSWTPPGTTASTTSLAVNATQALGAAANLSNIKLDFFKNDLYSEIGLIGHIYVNLDFLYRTAASLPLESSDSKEKNEISLYKYLKTIMSGIQSSIGSVNNFEIHVDPVDNKARIIDINITGDKTKDLFQLQVRNQSSTVRNFSLQSQIFPEQSSIMAISSQAKGGTLGMQNNTIIDFNKNLSDRVIPDKSLPIQDNPLNSANTKVAASLASILRLFAAFTQPLVQNANSGVQDTARASAFYGAAKNSLRDLIVYFQNVASSSASGRGILPTKFSFEMDGIGGLVIGHLFTLPPDILPKGYKGGTAGTKVAQTITGISHSLKGGDWVTKVDALNFILNDKSNGFKYLDIKTIIDEAFTATAASSSGRALGGNYTGATGTYTGNTVGLTGKMNGKFTPQNQAWANKLAFYRGFTAYTYKVAADTISYYRPAIAKTTIPIGIRRLMEAQSMVEGWANNPNSGARKYNNPGNAGANKDPKTQSLYAYVIYKTLEEGIQGNYDLTLGPVWNGKGSPYYNKNMTLFAYVSWYCPEDDIRYKAPRANDATLYTNEIISYFQAAFPGIVIDASTTLDTFYNMK